MSLLCKILLLRNSRLIKHFHTATSCLAGALSEQIFDREKLFGLTCVGRLPIALCDEQGTYVFDMEGKRYLDFNTGVNQGHSHPKIISALEEQAKKLTLTSRSVYNDSVGLLQSYLCKMFGYDSFLPVCTESEARETAFNLLLEWGCDVKKIPKEHVRILVCEGNYTNGNTFGVSTTGKHNFCQNIISVPYNNIESLEKALANPNVAGMLIEPIQSPDLITPEKGFLRNCRSLCDKYEILLGVDETQTGLGRTGKMLCIDHECVKADVVTIGLGGGVYPISGLLTDLNVLKCMKSHNYSPSKYGMSPLGAKIALAALEVIYDEKLCQNSEKQGHQLRCLLRTLPKEIITEVRGKGLLNGILLHQDYDSWDICLKLSRNGLIAVPSSPQFIHLYPSLGIKDREVKEASDIFRQVFCALKEDNQKGCKK